jgi:hypothetical protein
VRPSGIPADVFDDISGIAVAVIDGDVPHRGDVAPGVELGDLAQVIKVRPPGLLSGTAVRVDDDDEG